MVSSAMCVCLNSDDMAKVRKPVANKDHALTGERYSFQ